jgi:hypothetical protein
VYLKLIVFSIAAIPGMEMRGGTQSSQQKDNGARDHKRGKSFHDLCEACKSRVPGKISILRGYSVIH